MKPHNYHTPTYAVITSPRYSGTAEITGTVRSQHRTAEQARSRVRRTHELYRQAHHGEPMLQLVIIIVAHTDGVTATGTEVT